MKKNNIFLMVLGACASVAAGFGVGMFAAKRIFNTQNQMISSSRDKFKLYYDLTRELMKNEIAGKDVSEFFKRENISRIAVYGGGTMGELFCSAMKNDRYKISYFIEETGVPIPDFIEGIPLKTLEYGVTFEGIDMVVVTAVSYYKDIRKSLEEIGCDCPIVSFEDIAYSL